ncbi:related to choline dehydrogenase [Ramularia collo-cygni]|uniref:Related to choline dehydrogenase n=1 Tax=Ramularia collo-cygni TaxID=112498 RepID=A0A2D3V5N9_9PEZI|nr:related to choline dehydrogenase [Ramularia collo-cygni]CZT20770.1 related to choline dehydrogenase [Ramularia collo-cygni]
MLVQTLYRPTSLSGDTRAIAHLQRHIYNVSSSSVIPGLAFTQFVGASPDDNQPLIDWGFVTTPQAGANNRSIQYARGKTIGGSSARNYMAFHRGTNGSYQRWAEEVDDNSYALSNLMKYFQRSVTLTPPNSDLRFANSSVEFASSAFNNSLYPNQPLQVTWGNWAYPIASWTQLALAKIGIPTNPQGFLSGQLSGSSWCPSTIEPDNQHRSSSQTSFLNYAMRTTGLKTYSHCFARKVVFNGTKATGVLLQAGRKNFTLTANKEVILSAGAFQSPQLLMVSGIGPRETLQRLNIPVVADLPGVGQDLWDQPLWGISYRVNVLTGSESVNNPAYAAMAVELFIANGTGPLASPPSLLAFERLSDSAPELLQNSTLQALEDFPSDWPQIEYLVQNGYAGDFENSMTADPADGYNYATLAACLVSPSSKGNVTISSADASVPPVINPNWLTTSEDKDLAVASFKRLRLIWSHMSNVTIGEEYFPGLEVESDEQILAFIQQSMIQLYHASATCKMGRRSDPLAVLDSKARVYGVDGLRVVDASSFPFLPPGHPQATVYMLAEKIAEDVKQELQL